MPPVSFGGGITRGVSAAIMRGLSKARDKRFSNCKELVAAVKRGLEETPPAAGQVARSDVLDDVDLDAYPETLVRIRAKQGIESVGTGEEPDTEPMLSLRDEVTRLEDLTAARDAAEHAAKATEPEAEGEEESAFSLDDSLVAPKSAAKHSASPPPSSMQDKPGPVDDDEVTYEGWLTERLPREAVCRPKKLRAVGAVFRCGGDRPLDQKESRVKLRD